MYKKLYKSTLLFSVNSPLVTVDYILWGC